MTTELITCTAPPEGANLFARHRTPGRLRRDAKHQSLNSSGLTPRRPSHLPRGLIAQGQANKFTPTKAAWPTGRSIGRKTLPGRQNGFTMIELIMVIVVLGLLSAFALPRFVDAAADARAARVNVGLGAARSALAIVHINAVVKGIGVGEVAQGFRYIFPTQEGEAPRFEPWPGSSLPVTAADCRRN